MQIRMIAVALSFGLSCSLGAAELKVERLGNDLWRVRLKRNGAAQWPESGMNRYGVFADLPALETSASLDGAGCCRARRRPGRRRASPS